MFGAVIAITLSTGVYAQEAPRMPELTPSDTSSTARINSTSISLERNLNTFNWIGRALIDTMAWGTNIKVNEQYTSSVILLDGSSSSRNLQSNQQNLSLLLGRPIAKGLTSELQWTSLVYSDNKSVGLGTTTFHSVLGGVGYSPIDFLTLTPLVGYRWDKQLGIRDDGLSYTITGRAEGIDLDGYQLNGAAQFHEDRLNPRVLQRHFAHLGAQKFFSANTRDSLDVGYGRNRREFYSIADGNIESRVENVLSFFNLLDYELLPRVVTSVFVNVSSRSLDRDIRHFRALPDTGIRINTAIDEFKLETYVQTTYTSDDGGLMAAVRLGHSERTEEHSAKLIPLTTPRLEFEFNRRNNEEQTKNNLARRTSLSGLLRLPLSASDRLFFSGAVSILRDDTPSELNMDDRDELLVALSLATYHRLSQYFSLDLVLEGNLSHVVYLFGSNPVQLSISPSANNNYNRVLRFLPSAIYRPTKAITSKNTFEVLANYTVYDFEQQVIRSFSYRQFGWIDSSAVDVSRRIGLDFFGYLKLYERGQFKWSDFSERTENSFVDRTIAGQVRFSPEDGILFAVGIRYFSQSRYAFGGGVKTLDAYVRSVGPTCLIDWKIGSYSRLTFKGWYERRTFTGGQGQSQQVSQSLPNMSMNILINL
ncbi:MAG: hypothetical protein HW412_994 [Bacteroidetes bacterium]|nr:hypothetical protein [Bacteroidota bacterium]